MGIKQFKSINQIDEDIWEKLNNGSNPFLSYQFLKGLEESGSIGPEKGWIPKYLFLDEQGKEAILFYFEKNHSYGEYIFDWAWADAYHQHGVPYYPKMTAMIPFTPVTAPHFLMTPYDQNSAHLLLGHMEKIYSNNAYSSSHFLFLSPGEIPLFESREYLIRESMQYHFFNEGYSDFDHLLERFKTRKAKKIRKERMIANDLKIRSFTGDQLTNVHAQNMFRFYNSTIIKNGAIAYLNQAYFNFIFSFMKENIFYVQASHADKPVAGALFFYGTDRLYGRLWGALLNYPNLHFEMCYYQGIDFCLKNHLSVFEAGAQGTHKIKRGFKPVKTYSAHLIKEPVFRHAIKNFVHEEKTLLNQSIEELGRLLPFK